MGKLTILDKKKVAVKAVSGGMIVPPTIDFKIEVELADEIFKEASKDKLLVKKFADQAKEILEFTVKIVEDKIKVFEKLFQDMLLKGAPSSLIEKSIDGLNDKIKKDFEVAMIAAQQGCDKVWKELQDHHKEWKKFRNKTIVSIVATLAVLAISIAALASSPWTGGAGAAFAIIGFIKSGVKLSKDIAKLAIDFDTALADMKRELAFVEATVKNKGLQAANEITAAVLNEFLGIAQPSIKSAQSAGETLKAKFSKMVVDNHTLSKEVTKMEAEAKQLSSKYVEDAKKKLKSLDPKVQAYTAKRIKENCDKMMAPILKDIATKNAEVMRMYEKTKTMAPQVKALLERLKALELKDPKGLKVFREALKFAVLGLAPLDGNGIANTAQNLGLGLGSALSGYGLDKTSSKYFEGTVFDAA